MYAMHRRCLLSCLELFGGQYLCPGISALQFTIIKENTFNEIPSLPILTIYNVILSTFTVIKSKIKLICVLPLRIRVKSLPDFD